jgi:hypothetical protein
VLAPLVDRLLDFLEERLHVGMPDVATDIRKFILTLYVVYPPGSVTSRSIVFPDRHIRFLALWADVLAHLRAKVIANAGVKEVDNVEHAERDQRVEEVARRPRVQAEPLAQRDRVERAPCELRERRRARRRS